MYKTRKEYMINSIEKELIILLNKVKYIKENLDGTIDLRKKKKDQVNEMLKEKKYDIIENDEDYKYLIKMPMDSVTEENIEKLLKDKIKKETELDKIKNTTINEMWINELDNLNKNYIEYKNERKKLLFDEKKKKNNISLLTNKKNVKKVFKIIDNDIDE